MNARVEAEPADRIVDVCCVACEKDAPNPKLRCNTLMNLIKIAVNDVIGLRKRKCALQPRMHGVVIQRFLVRFIGSRRKHSAPASLTVISRNFEKIDPFVGVGKVIPIAAGHHALKVIENRKSKKVFREGVALELNLDAFSNRTASAICADHVIRAKILPAVRMLDGHGHGTRILTNGDGSGAEHDPRAGKFTEMRDSHVCKLVLLGLDNEWK